MAIIWKGGWVGNLNTSDVTYYKDEIVSYNNITYIATSPSIPTNSPAPPQDMGNWDIVVNGAMGTSGTSGTTGTSGTRGTSGTSGTTGTSGTSGTVGTSGTSGVSPLGNSQVFTAGTAGTSWTFTHNLGVTRPFVQVWSTSGMVIIPQEITSVDSNNIKIDFPEPVAGTAIIGNGYSGTSGSSGTSGAVGTSGTSGTSPFGQGVYYTQGTAGTSWTVSHNLNVPIPLVQVFDSSNRMILPQDITLTDNNTTTITFAVARTGRALITNGNASTSGTSGTSGISGSSGTSGIGFPGGGTSGQVLVKNSSTSGDASWTTFTEINTSSGTANDNVAFVTPWNFSLKMDSVQQQFFISVDATGASRYVWGQRLPQYHRISAGVGNSSLAYATWNTPAAGTWYSWWTDTTLAMSTHGDTEWGLFRVAASQTAYSLGQYEEFEITMVLGASYNNNYFRVKKTK